MAAWVIWFIIAGILFIAEMLSITFYMLWLGIGAVVGGLIALFAFLYEKNIKKLSRSKRFY